MRKLKREFISYEDHISDHKKYFFLLKVNYVNLKTYTYKGEICVMKMKLTLKLSFSEKAPKFEEISLSVLTKRQMQITTLDDT